MDTDAETHLNNAVTKEFAAAGYPDDHIRSVLNKQAELKNNGSGSLTWTRVHRRHVLPETLSTYQIPWQWDEDDMNFIVIKQMMCESSMDQLYEHTKRLRVLKQNELRYETVDKKASDMRHRRTDGDRKKWRYY